MPDTITAGPNIDSNITVLTLHRGQVFEEMTEAFKHLNLTDNLQIQVVLPNGKMEAVVDFGCKVLDIEKLQSSSSSHY